VELQSQHAMILNWNNASHAHDHYNYFRARMANYGAELDAMLESALLLFEEARGIPVQLSMLVIIFEHAANGALMPTSRRELYQQATHGALRQRIRMQGAEERTEAAGDEAFKEVLDMLERVAVTAHAAEKREFRQDDHVRVALAVVPKQLLLWDNLLAEARGVPLIKLIEVGEGISNFQFKHLSFQEGLFAQAFLDEQDTEEEGKVLVKSKGLIDDPWFLNALRIGGSALGVKLAEPLKAGMDVACLELSEPQCNAMIALEWEPLRVLKRLETLVIPRRMVKTFDRTELESLVALIKNKDALGALRTLELGGVPVACDKHVAQLIAATAKGSALHALKFGRKFEMQVFLHRSEVGVADAVLLAATLRGALEIAASLGHDNAKQLLSALAKRGGDWVQAACFMVDDELRRCLGVIVPSSTGTTRPLGLASVLREAGGGISWLQHLTVLGSLLAGFTVGELREAGFLWRAQDGADGELMRAVKLVINVVQEADGSSEADGFSEAAHRVALQFWLAGFDERQLRDAAKFETKLSWISMMRPLAGNSIQDLCQPDLIKIDLSRKWDGVSFDPEDAIWQTQAPGVTSQALAALLKHRDDIMWLKLSNQNIGDAAAIAIAGALRVNAGTLTCLQLNGSAIGDAGAVAIAQTLRVNDVLKELVLWKNNIGDNGAVAIAEALGVNAALQYLDLTYNQVGDIGAVAIGEALHNNTVLTYLRLGSNSFCQNSAMRLNNAVLGRAGLRLFF
jgi:hypothetical protein